MKPIQKAFELQLAEFPAMILKMEDLGVQICCAKCDGVIEKTHTCLDNDSELSDKTNVTFLLSEHLEVWINKRSCPHCLNPCPKAILGVEKAEKGRYFFLKDEKTKEKKTSDRRFVLTNVLSLETKKVKVKKFITRRETKVRVGWFRWETVPEEFYLEKEEI